MKESLKKIPVKELQSSIRIALIHHHPVAIPALIESGKGYDAVLNSGQLLNVLRQFGFQIVLHGHKHYPCFFSYDVICPWINVTHDSLKVISGGSVGSKDLPNDELNRCNVYNIITVFFDSDTKSSHIQLNVRKLKKHNENGEHLLAHDLKFEKLRSQEFGTMINNPIFPRISGNETRNFISDTFEEQRQKTVNELRNNFPTAEVVPSKAHESGYEIRLWITTSHEDNNIPIKVEWSCGEGYPVVVCMKNTNPKFAASYSYVSPILIQAKLYFDDNITSVGYVHAAPPKAHR